MEKSSAIESRGHTLSPRTVDAPVVEAFALALEAGEPVFVPSSVFADDRGWSIMNQFRGVMSAEGQINFSMQYPGTIKAWHRHTKQTDFWLCLTGHIKLGVHCGSTQRSWAMVIGEKRPGVVIIPPPLWHGAATVGPSPAGLLYYVTHGYDAAAPDEERMPYDAVEGFPWEPVNR